MPRDGSNIYSQPFPDVVADTTIESTVYNGFVADIATDLNAPRPIIAGGTGATNADESIFNMGAEKAGQVVTNFDSHVWMSGSFRAATSATGGPVASHAFAGTAYINEALAYPSTNQNVIIEARDESDSVVPGRIYVREKKAGVWSAWVADPHSSDVASGVAGLALKVAKAGDTMTGHLALPTGPAAANAVRKDYVDAADTALSAALTAAYTAAITAAARVGSVVQSVSFFYSDYQSTSVVLPYDNTIPQITEGMQILDVSITPTSATNKLRIRSIVCLAASTADLWGVAALFRDSTANALAAVTQGAGNQQNFTTISLEWEVVAGSTATTAFKVRVGPRATGTIYVNGTSASAMFGGVSRCTLIVEEIKV